MGTAANVVLVKYSPGEMKQHPEDDANHFWRGGLFTLSFTSFLPLSKEERSPLIKSSLGEINRVLHKSCQIKEKERKKSFMKIAFRSFLMDTWKLSASLSIAFQLLIVFRR